MTHNEKGYLNNEIATKNSITPDGWFKTGDVAIRDTEGFYYIVDRKKELIKYKVRFNVNDWLMDGLIMTSSGISRSITSVL
jgi:acyl-coenzyme A synthetase/AMP-(fatty) acid ligase